MTTSMDKTNDGEEQQLNAVVADLTALRTSIISLNTKLDTSIGNLNAAGTNLAAVAGTNFAAVVNPAALTSQAPARAIGLPINSAADVDLLLKRLSNTSLDFTPTHILRPVGSTFKDMLDSWDLTSTGGDATITPRAIKTVKASANAWVASANSKFQFGTSNFAFLMITRFLAVGSGGYFISNLKGPDGTDPYAPGGPFGQDKGYGISHNGDGGLGIAVYGVNGYANTDTADGTINHADSTWRAYAWGYSQTSSIAFLTASDFNIAHNVAVGNTNNTDAIFGYRCNYYNINQSNATQETALLCVFEGTAAQNIYLQRSNFLPGLQSYLQTLV